MEREEGGERCAVWDSIDGGRLEEREDRNLYALRGRHPGVWGYCWDLGSGERDKVKKVCDHAMDEIRYFVATIVAGEESGAQFFVGAVERRGW
ncbi:MAG: hypothetical protein ACLUNZ_00035 [Evtepia sp.]